MKRIVFNPDELLELFEILDSTNNNPVERKRLLSSKVKHLDFDNKAVYDQFVCRIKAKQKLYIQSGYNKEVLIAKNGRPKLFDNYVCLKKRQKNI